MDFRFIYKLNQDKLAAFSESLYVAKIASAKTLFNQFKKYTEVEMDLRVKVTNPKIVDDIKSLNFENINLLNKVKELTFKLEEKEKEIRNLKKTPPVFHNMTMKQVQNKFLIYSLEKNNWNIVKTSKELGITRRSIYNYLKEIKND